MGINQSKIMSYKKSQNLILLYKLHINIEKKEKRKKNYIYQTALQI